MATLSLKLEPSVYFDASADASSYRIRASITNRTGDIDPAVFLITIGDTVTRDAFSKVVGLGDLAAYPVGRDIAITRGVSSYRLSNVDIFYDDYEESVAAITSIKEEVNSYVEEYNSYTGVFNPSNTSVNVTLSGADLSYLEELKEQHQGLLSELSTLEDSVETLSNDMETVTTAHTEQVSRVVNLRVVVDSLAESVRGIMTTQKANYDYIATFAGLSPSELTTVNGYASAAVAIISDPYAQISTAAALLSQERALQETKYQAILDKDRELSIAVQDRDAKQLEADRVLATILTLDSTYTY